MVSHHTNITSFLGVRTNAGAEVERCGRDEKEVSTKGKDWTVGGGENVGTFCRALKLIPPATQHINASCCRNAANH